MERTSELIDMCICSVEPYADSGPDRSLERNMLRHVESPHGVQSDWQVAAFRTKLDTIAVLQTSRSIETRMLDGARPPVLSVVAFA